MLCDDMIPRNQFLLDDGVYRSRPLTNAYGQKHHCRQNVRYPRRLTLVAISSCRANLVFISHLTRTVVLSINRVSPRTIAGEFGKQRESSMQNRISMGVDEAAKAVGIGQTKLREEIAAKRLIARKLGKRTLIAMVDLESWIANLPQIAA